jgi:PII-like signaling protein
VSDALQMRFHFGERDRDGDRPLDAAVMEACARRGVRAAALLRGVEGFGAKQRLRTDRLLSLSEDAPLVAAAVGDAEVVEGLADEVRGMAAGGLVVLERVEVLGGRDGAHGRHGGVRITGTATTSAGEVAAPVIGAPGDGAEGAPGDRAEGAPADVARGRSRDVVKVTLWGPRSGPGSPHLGAVAALRRHGAEAATVLLGVDGVLDGERRRARFVPANRGVPAMTVAVGERARIEAALAEVDGPAHLVTVEAVESSSRIAGASHHGEGAVERNSGIDRVSHHGDASTPAAAEATRVTLVTSEVAAHGSHPVYLELIHRLRHEGALGATALRGVWGFRGEGEPHGDRVLALRRDVPMLVETVDAPDHAARWLDLARSLACEGDVVDVQPIPRAFTLE